MAKASSTPKKKSSEAPKKTTAAKKTISRAKAVSIDTVCEQIAARLSALGIEQGLRNDIEWCLGSYRHDHNPTGLYEMAGKALSILKLEKKKSAKSVPATLLTAIEKVLPKS
jgi:hypothetical protein